MEIWVVLSHWGLAGRPAEQQLTSKHSSMWLNSDIKTRTIMCNRGREGRDGATKQTPPCHHVTHVTQGDPRSEHDSRRPNLSLLSFNYNIEVSWKWNTFHWGHSQDLLRVVIWCKSSFWRDLGTTLFPTVFRLWCWSPGFNLSNILSSYNEYTRQRPLKSQWMSPS